MTINLKDEFRNHISKINKPIQRSAISLGKELIILCANHTEQDAQEFMDLLDKNCLPSDVSGNIVFSDCISIWTDHGFVHCP